MQVGYCLHFNLYFELVAAFESFFAVATIGRPQLCGSQCWMKIDMKIKNQQKFLCCRRKTNNELKRLVMACLD